MFPVRTALQSLSTHGKLRLVILPLRDFGMISEKESHDTGALDKAFTN